MTHFSDLEQLGFAVIPNLLTEEQRRGLAALFDGDSCRAGRRNGLACKAVRDVVTSDALRSVVHAIMGMGAFATKATLFDKTSASNWLVPWHQDVTIPVRKRQATAGYDAWSTKDGVTFVRPPSQALESMIAVRLDLDGTSATNGPLRVLPKTHTHGFLSPDGIQAILRTQPPVSCHVPQSGGLVMRPLLLHASSKASTPAHRRIAHIEFAADELPGAVDWHERCALGEPFNQAMHPDGDFAAAGDCPNRWADEDPARP